MNSSSDNCNWFIYSVYLPISSEQLHAMHERRSATGKLFDERRDKCAPWNEKWWVKGKLMDESGKFKKIHFMFLLLHNIIFWPWLTVWLIIQSLSNLLTICIGIGWRWSATVRGMPFNFWATEWKRARLVQIHRSNSCHFSHSSRYIMCSKWKQFMHCIYSLIY